MEAERTIIENGKSTVSSKTKKREGSPARCERKGKHPCKEPQSLLLGRIKHYVSSHFQAGRVSVLLLCRTLAIAD